MGCFVVPLHSFFPLKQSEPFVTASPSPHLCPSLPPSARLSPSCLRSHMLWIRTVVHREPWILSETFSFLISAACFTLNLLPRAKRQHGIYETCTRCRKRDYSLSIWLSILFSPYPRQRGNGEDVLTPSDGRAAPHSFCSPLFLLPPSIPFSSILPPHSSSFALSALLLPLQRLSFSTVSISLPRAQRQFSRSSLGLFHPLFLPLWLSLTRVWRSYWYSQIQTA